MKQMERKTQAQSSPSQSRRLPREQVQEKNRRNATPMQWWRRASRTPCGLCGKPFRSLRPEQLPDKRQSTIKNVDGVHHPSNADLYETEHPCSHAFHTSCLKHMAQRFWQQHQRRIATQRRQKSRHSVIEGKGNRQNYQDEKEDEEGEGEGEDEEDVDDESEVENASSNDDDDGADDNVPFHLHCPHCDPDDKCVHAFFRAKWLRY